MKFEYLSDDERRQIVWDQLGLRIGYNIPPDDVEQLLAYDIAEVPDSPMNGARDDIMSFINNNRDRLSLRCDGNCYAHSDGMVTNCYRQLLNDQGDV
jgi:hypothetical protein